MRSDKGSLEGGQGQALFFPESGFIYRSFYKIGRERVQDYEVWERTLRSQGEFKDAERMLCLR
jgi:hypothetical protein